MSATRVAGNISTRTDDTFGHTSMTSRLSNLEEKYFTRGQLLEEKATLEAELESITQDAAELRAKLLMANTDLGPVKGTLEGFEETVRACKAEIGARDSEIEAIKADMAVKTRRHEELTAKAVQLHDRVSMLEGTMRAHADAIMQAAAGIDAARRLELGEDFDDDDNQTLRDAERAAQREELNEMRRKEDEIQAIIDARDTELNTARTETYKSDQEVNEMRGLITRLSSMMSQRPAGMTGPPGSNLYVIGPCNHMILSVGQPMVINRDRCPKCCARVTKLVKIEVPDAFARPQ